MSEIDIPADLPAQLQAIRALHMERDRLAARLETVKGEISRRETRAQSTMDTLDCTSFSSDGIDADIEDVVVYKANDWGSLYTFVMEHGAFELLHKRLSITALREYSKLNALPPGIEEIPLKKIKVTF